MGGRGGGRGGFRGRGRGGGFGGSSSLPPMGLSFSDIQSMSKEGTELYPPIIPPVLEAFSLEDSKICARQLGFTTRLRMSKYYVVEKVKTTELERYSDKYKPLAASQPTLRKADLHAPFFPNELLEGYLNPKKKTQSHKKAVNKISLDELNEEEEDDENKSDNASDVGSEPHDDYDVDEEFDNDYAGNYFDNGEGDNFDDLGDGGGGDEGGGDYD